MGLVVSIQRCQGNLRYVSSCTVIVLRYHPDLRRKIRQDSGCLVNEKRGAIFAGARDSQHWRSKNWRIAIRVAHRVRVDEGSQLLDPILLSITDIAICNTGGLQRQPNEFSTTRYARPVQKLI